MGFSLSDLSAFTLEDSGILIQKAVLGVDLINYIDFRPGYPNATVAINVLDVTPGFVTGDCGWSATGSTTYTQIDITNTTKSWQQSLCLDDLRGYWLSTQMDASAFGEKLPFEQVISDQIVLKTKKYAEELIGTSIIAQTGTASAATVGTASTPTSANMYSIAQALIDVLPLAVQSRDDLGMLMSYANFRKLCVNMVTLNLYHWDTGHNVAGSGMGQSVIVPGTNIRAIPVAGFGTSNRIIVGPLKHIIQIAGLMEDTERIEAWWSRDNQEIRTLARFTTGVGVLAEEFVTNGLA